jgi:hypothetical protein
MANRGNTWELPLGDGAIYDVNVVNGQGAVITGQYTGSEPLIATVWEGSNLTALPGVLSVTWSGGTNPPSTNASNGITFVTVNGSATTGLTYGYYRVKLEVTYGGITSPYYYGWLKLTPVAASAVEKPTYNALADLLDKAGDWLPRMLQESQLTNFVAERARARSWLDDIIISRSRVFAYRFDLNYALYYGSFPFGPVEAPDQVIATYLASNYLIVKDRTIECVTYKALSYISEKRHGMPDSDIDWIRYSNWYALRASNAVKAYRAELDTNGDGYTDIAFNLGVLTFR